MNSLRPVKNDVLPALRRPDVLPALVGGSPSRLGATTDEAAVKTWLRKFERKAHTLSAYQREAERFLEYMRLRGMTLESFTVEAAQDYQYVLRHPPMEWCVVQVPRFLADGRENPEYVVPQKPRKTLEDGSRNREWRPFIGALSEAAAVYAERVVSALFKWLASVNYLVGNPMAAVQSRKPYNCADQIEHIFSKEGWLAVLDYIESMPRETKRQVQHYNRDKFIVHFLCLSGLRRFEMAKATTQDLIVVRGQYWLNVVGKGGKHAQIPLNSAAVEALREYRASTGRAGLPVYGAPAEPLLMDVVGRGVHLTAKSLGEHIKGVFQKVADSVRERDPGLAAQIEHASIHWLRHQSVSRQIEAGVPPLTVQQNARHSRFSTTQLYIHTDKDLQHQATEAHSVR